MGRGANKETSLEVKGEKQRIVVGLKRSRPIICVELSLPRSLFGILGHSNWPRLPSRLGQPTPILTEEPENCQLSGPEQLRSASQVGRVEARED
jgi:hypothetical protein